LLDAPADGGESVDGDQPGRLDQVGDELGDLVDREGRTQPGAPLAGRGFTGAGLAGQPKLVGPLEVYRTPSNEVSAKPG
jgi:hypothetical protein